MRIARIVVLFALASSLLGCGVGAHGHGHADGYGHSHHRRQAKDTVILVKVAILLVELAVRGIEYATTRSSVAKNEESESRDARDTWEPPPSSWSVPTSTATTPPPPPPPAAPAAPLSPPPPASATSDGPPPPARFDAAAARTVLHEARVFECRDRGVPRGYVRATATFASTGAVKAVAIEQPSNLSDAARACVEQRVRIAVIPAFAGGDFTTRATWFVP